MNGKHNKILEELKRKSVISIGGTEAVSVAYAVAYAKKKAVGSLKNILITVDSSIFKNGLNVVIPGCDERGLDIAAALGYVCGHEEDKLQVLSRYGKADVTEAKKLLAQGKVHIRIKDDCDKLYIETVIESEGNTVRIFILDFHLNIILEETVARFEELSECQFQNNRNYIVNENMGLDDFVDFIHTVDVKDLEFIEEGLRYNLALSQYQSGHSLVTGFEKTLARYHVKDDMVTVTQNLCMKACEAQIMGAKLPVMTTVGSANYGIITYLTNYGVGNHIRADKDKIIKAIALSNLMSMYVNSYVGSPSSVCGCSLAAGIGASVGVVYLFDGDADAMERAVKNMVGSVTGIICDGSKIRCAWKLGLSVDWSIKSALMALDSCCVDCEGILAESLDKVFENISSIYNPVSNTTNQSIVDIILGKRYE